MMRPRTLAVACLVALGSPAAADEFCASDELTELVNDPSPCRGHTELILSPAAMPSPPHRHSGSGIREGKCGSHREFSVRPDA